MKVLGIETSGDRGGVALLEDGEVLGCRIFEKGMVHGREVAPSIQAILDERGLEPAAIDLVACDIGPGSYTGIRVGLAAAKGLVLALNCPLIGVPSLDAMAEAAKDQAPLICPARDARSGRIYGALYRDGRRTTDFFAEKPAAFVARVPKDALVFGDALDAYGELFRDFPKGPRDCWDPRPEAIARLGLRLHGEGIRQDAATLVPLYLRPTETERKFGRKT